MIIMRFTEEQYEELKRVLQDWADEGFVAQFTPLHLELFLKFGIK
jgi:hypothetical protein